MRDIFSDLYDKVLSFFTTSNPNETKALAKNRLKSVLAQDRVGFSERAMQMLKDDMLETIAKYLEINVESFDLSIGADNDMTVLNLSIPVIRPKTDEEIDEALAQEHNEKIEKTKEIVGEIEVLVKEKAAQLAQELNAEDVQDDSETEQIQQQDETEEENEEDKEDVEQQQNSNVEKNSNDPIEHSSKKSKKNKKKQEETQTSELAN